MAVNSRFHNTLWVPAHFHSYFLMGVVLMILGTVWHVLQQATGLPEQPCPKAESPPNIVNVVSYGASCEAVEDAMSQIKSVSRQFRIGDFECTRTSGTRLSGAWECKGEAAYFTFDFGD